MIYKVFHTIIRIPEFLKDAIKDYETEEDINLSRLIFYHWLNSNYKDNDGINEEEITRIIDDMKSISFSEEEDLSEYLFMFGYKMREDNRLQKIGFENRIGQHFGLEFYYIELIEILSRELGELLHDALKEEEIKLNNIQKIVFYQHVRTCSIFSEVIHLLKGGYGNGALARFRSLHELAVVTEFIYTHGEEAAEAYIDYLSVMDLKDMNFEEKELGNDIVDNDYKNELQEEMEKLKEKRGDSFVNLKAGDYEWARPFMENNNNPSFRKITNSINRVHGKKPYKIASNSIHSAPKSMYSSISTIDGRVSGGASNIGLSLPGSWATYEILQMNSIVLQLISENEVDLLNQLQVLFIIQMINELSLSIYKNFPDRENELIEGEMNNE